MLQICTVFQILKNTPCSSVRKYMGMSLGRRCQTLSEETVLAVIWSTSSSYFLYSELLENGVAFNWELIDQYVILMACKSLCLYLEGSEYGWWAKATNAWTQKLCKVLGYKAPLRSYWRIQSFSYSLAFVANKANSSSEPRYRYRMTLRIL